MLGCAVLINIRIFTCLQIHMPCIFTRTDSVSPGAEDKRVKVLLIQPLGDDDDEPCAGLFMVGGRCY